MYGQFIVDYECVFKNYYRDNYKLGFVIVINNSLTVCDQLIELQMCLAVTIM